MKIRKSAVTLWFLVLLGMVIVSGCGPVTVETPTPETVVLQPTQTAIALAQLELEQTRTALVATQTAMAFTATPTASPQAEPTATPEPTDTPTLGPTDTPMPTDTPTAPSTAIAQAEPAATSEPADTPTATPTPRVVNITGIICKVPDADMVFNIWLPQKLIDAYFTSLGTTPPFSATVRPVHPETGALIGQWVLLTVDSYAHSQGMRDRKDCDLSMSKDVRQALCGGDPPCDLDEIVDKPIEERIQDRTLDRTLRFEIKGE